MLIKETLYALDDVTIIPAPQSNVRHRADIKVTYDNGVVVYVNYAEETVSADGVTKEIYLVTDTGKHFVR